MCSTLGIEFAKTYKIKKSLQETGEKTNCEKFKGNLCNRRRWGTFTILWLFGKQKTFATYVKELMTEPCMENLKKQKSLGEISFKAYSRTLMAMKSSLTYGNFMSRA